MGEIACKGYSDAHGLDYLCGSTPTGTLIDRCGDCGAVDGQKM
jgi:hypothetical protein